MVQERTIARANQSEFPSRTNRGRRSRERRCWVGDFRPVGRLSPPRARAAAHQRRPTPQPSLRARALPSLTDRAGQVREKRRGGVPAQAAVGDAHSVGEALRIAKLLLPLLEEALYHDAEDPGAAGSDLTCDVACDLRLLSVVLAAVTVAAIDENALTKAGLREQLADVRDAGCFVVGPGGAAPQNDMAIRIAGRLDDRGEPLLGDAEKAMWMRRRDHRVDRQRSGVLGAV